MRTAPRFGPSLMTAAIPAAMATATASEVNPSITISSTQAASGSSAVSTAPRNVGQKAWLVDAGTPLYFEPTLEPDRTMPPGNGVMVSGTLAIAAVAASAAASVAGAVRPMIKRLPPPTACLVSPVVASQTNSPSITGIRQ